MKSLPFIEEDLSNKKLEISEIEFDGDRHFFSLNWFSKKIPSLYIGAMTRALLVPLIDKFRKFTSSHGNQSEVKAAETPRLANRSEFAEKSDLSNSVTYDKDLKRYHFAYKPRGTNDEYTENPEWTIATANPFKATTPNQKSVKSVK